MENSELQKIYARAQKADLSDVAATRDNAFEHVVFTFEHVERDWGFDNKAMSLKMAKGLLKKMQKLSASSWVDLIRLDKKSGFEELPVSNLRIGRKSPQITKDVEKLLVFRFAGQDARAAGLRRGNIFDILYLDFELKLWKHD